MPGSGTAPGGGPVGAARLHVCWCAFLGLSLEGTPACVYVPSSSIRPFRLAVQVLAAGHAVGDPHIPAITQRSQFCFNVERLHRVIMWTRMPGGKPAAV